MLIGEYRHNIDEKNRLVLPMKYRETIGDKCIITRGIENCLYVYSLSEWQELTTKLESLPFTKKDARNFNRFFMSGAVDGDFDKQGRVCIPSFLSDYANISKECVIVGVGNRLEIWSNTNWDKFFNDNQNTLVDVAEHLFDNNF